jgi:endonuclease YncB( thermonuclease family)
MRARLLVALLCFTWTATNLVAVDGDTVRGDLALAPGLTLHATIRLVGVDAPERTGPTRIAGEAARAFTAEWLRRRVAGALTVWGLCRTDSFGRILGGVTADGESLAAALLAAGHAVPDVR